MSIVNSVLSVGDDFISLLFPRLCQACGNNLVRNEEVLCLSCILDLPYTDLHLKKDNAVEKVLWGRCYVERASAMCYFRKGSKVQALIHRLKYVGVKSVGLYLGKIYGRELKNTYFLDSIDLIIPVPLHPTKQRTRGFNQSELIGKGIESVTGIKMTTKALYRVVKSESQTRKGREERWENVASIFEVINSELISGKHILLIDDVITTGATIEASVNALKMVKDVKVSVLAIATALQDAI